MTPQEYDDRLKDLRKEFQQKEQELVKECALSNNPYKVGDIVTDHIGSVRVEKIYPATSNHRPTCLYDGVELKKDLTPKKNNPRRHAWQINLIKK